MSEQQLTIGKLAEAASVSVETVRFYQRKGLLETPEKEGSIRRYDKAALRQLRFIRKAQEAGFTLKEIQELITLDAGQDHQRAFHLAS
jgi:MerR family mercuric resistance operon transcriptional regulator